MPDAFNRDLLKQKMTELKVLKEKQFFLLHFTRFFVPLHAENLIVLEKWEK